MKLLLVRPPNPLGDVKILSHIMPLNLAYLAAYVRSKGAEVRILDYESEPYSDSQFRSYLADYGPQMVGFSCMTPTINLGNQMATGVKEWFPSMVTAVGGPHANGLPRETIERYPAFDLLVYGEGEITLSEICKRIDRSESLAGIEGTYHRSLDGVAGNPPRGLVNDLDSLPFPARELLPAAQVGHCSRGFSNRLRSTSFYTSRGCPFACTFCAIRNTFGTRVRFRGLSFIDQEVKELRDKFDFRHLVIADDTFSLNSQRAGEICDIFRSNGIESWSCDTRANTVTKELLLKMKRSGCQKVAFGVESGSERILAKNKKQITIDQVSAAVGWARDAGIKHIEGNFIIGSDPSETEQDIALTRSLILSLPWSFVSVSVIVPYPGTEVYAKMKEQGMIHADARWEDFVMFGRLPKWHTEHFSPETLVHIQRSLTRDFYLRPSYVMQQLFGIRSLDDIRYWCNAGISYVRWYFKGRV